MSDNSNILQFATTEEFLRHVTEICDDIDCVEIPVAHDIFITSDDGERRATDEVYMVLKLMNGVQHLILRREAETLLNSGIFHRMRIPIKLIKHKDQDAR